MKIKELIEILKTKEQDLEIIIQKDSEGNDYSPLYNYWTGYYVPNSSYSGEAYTKDDFDNPEDFEDIKKQGERVLFLTPTN